MCGICGIYNYRGGEPVDEALIRRMTKAMTHRGPDDEGVQLAGPAGLGMRRLSIIDLEGGHQPMSNEDGSIWVAGNGEIYNFPELRSELEALGHTFKARSDIETVVHAYEQWGDDVFCRLNGMFGLAIWDGTKRRLILARDHFGVKPLYLHDDGSRLVFGSEIKAILQDGSVPRGIDDTALDLYLTFRFVPSPRTLLAGIGKLRPGHCLVCDEAGVRTERYFRNPPSTLLDGTEDELGGQLRERLRAAVRRQMISDVPVGALLSGGVDSTTVVTLMREETGERVRTFTVGFEEPGAHNELAYARETAKRLDTDHHEVILSAGDAAGFWPKAMYHLEEPVVTPSVLPMYAVSRLAAEHVKVVLTGQGGDEPWAGYRRYKGERRSESYRRVPATLRDNVVAPIVEAIPRTEMAKRAVRSLGEADAAERFAKVYAVFTAEQKDLLYGRGGSGDGRPSVDVAAPIRYWQDEVSSLDGVAQMMYVDARLSLPDDFLLYGDKMSMAVSLEARVPLLDLELMDFVERLPSDLRLRGDAQKYLYRKAVAEWLPPEVLSRPKIGFETPMDRWLGDDFQGYARDLWFDSSALCGSRFDRSYLEKLLREHAQGRSDNQRQLFLLISLELWYQLFIGGKSVESLAP